VAVAREATIVRGGAVAREDVAREASRVREVTGVSETGIAREEVGAGEAAGVREVVAREARRVREVTGVSETGIAREEVGAGEAAGVHEVAGEAVEVREVAGARAASTDAEATGPRAGRSFSPRADVVARFGDLVDSAATVRVANKTDVEVASAPASISASVRSVGRGRARVRSSVVRFDRGRESARCV